MVQEKFGVATAMSIAKILLSCGLITENDLMEVASQIMEGNFNQGHFMAKAMKKKKTKLKKKC